MPGCRCAVYSCSNTQTGTKQTGENIRFHCFPKGADLLTTKMRNEWARRCSRTDKWNPSNNRICSIHFTENDYQRDMKNELLGLPVKKRLKKMAVPTLHLPNIKLEDADDTKEMLDIHLKNIFQDFPDPQLSASQAHSSTQTSTKDSLELELKNLFSKYDDLKTKHQKLKETTRPKLKSLKSQVEYYKKKCLKLTGTTQTETAKDILRNILTENQIALILNKKKRVSWTTEELTTAFTLMYYSKKCYSYIRNKLKYPLPGPSTVRRWAARLNMSQGLLKDVINLLNIAGETMNNFEKTVVLQFGEMKVKSTIEFADTDADEMIQPYIQLRVIMARGLFSNWKQPIYIGCDQMVTKEILLNVISELHHIAYNVVACVSDCGDSNIALWNELQIDINNTSFKHPLTDNSIYMFADVLHLLKLVRNWLLDTGFDLDDNTTIDKKPLESLIELNTEVNACCKISQKHIDCEETQRQNVRMAAELLSHTVGSALLHYKPGPNKKLAEDLGNFICNINEWFDIFNSYTKEENIPTKNAYGTNLQVQEEHLDKILQIITKMRAQGTNTLQTFQKGMILSIKSLKLLFHDMKSTFQIQYLCTHKLNLDCLENLFYQIRNSGVNNDHPTQLAAIRRIRMLIFGKNSATMNTQINTIEKAPEEYIAANILKKAQAKVGYSKHLKLDISESSNSSFSSDISEYMITENKDIIETTDDPDTDINPLINTIEPEEYIAANTMKKAEVKVDCSEHIKQEISECSNSSFSSNISEYMITDNKDILETTVDPLDF